MVYGRVSSSPELHGVIYPSCLFSYGLLIHTHLSVWGHDIHLHLILWILLSCLFHCYHIFFHSFWYRRVIILSLKNNSQASHLYWGDSPNYTYKWPGIATSNHHLNCCFDLSDFFSASAAKFLTRIILLFPLFLVSAGSLVVIWTIYDTYNSQTSGINIFNKYSSIYRGKYHTMEVHQYLTGTGYKNIYQLVDHDRSFLIIVIFLSYIYLIFHSYGGCFSPIFIL